MSLEQLILQHKARTETRIGSGEAHKNMIQLQNVKVGPHAPGLPSFWAPRHANLEPLRSRTASISSSTGTRTPRISWPSSRTGWWSETQRRRPGAFGCLGEAQ